VLEGEDYEYWVSKAEENEWKEIKASKTLAKIQN
jgi:hypothetical protein